MTAPAIGEIWATLAELPVILAASWVACGWTIARFQVPRSSGARAGMGLLALLFLLFAEMLLGVVGFGRTVEMQLAANLKTGPILGLLAQIAFACFHVVQR